MTQAQDTSVRDWNSSPHKDSPAVAATTEIVYIGDASGSMADLTNDTIGGFNAYIESQAKLPGDAFVTVVLFNTGVKTLAEHQDIKTLPKLTTKEYQAQGGTALLDAVGDTLNKLERNMPSYGIGNRVLVVIDTDGQENASREHKAADIKKQIERLTKAGWGFVFLGANDSAWQGHDLGIPSIGRTVASSACVQSKYANLNANTTSMRAGVQSFASSAGASNWNTGESVYGDTPT
jgi:Mg-chelatase subunit ChlD